MAKKVLNLNVEESGAVVGWNKKGLAGYLVQRGTLWMGVASTKSDASTHVFKRADSAIRWLKDTAAAESFETLSDADDLAPLVEVQNRTTRDPLSTRRMPLITGRTNEEGIID